MAEISSPTVIHPKLTLPTLPDIKLAVFFSSITCNGEVANFRCGIRCGFADLFVASWDCIILLLCLSNHLGHGRFLRRKELSICQILFPNFGQMDFY